MVSTRGRLIALEGVDGSGKSTQSRLLAERLGALLTREPGGTAHGRAIRSIVLEGEALLDPRAEALLMLADRAQHCAEVIEPALSAGRWVVSDRFAASTLAYQGYGRGLETAELERISAWAARSLVPDVYVLVEVPLGLGESRRCGKDGSSSGSTSQSARSSPSAPPAPGSLSAPPAPGSLSAPPAPGSLSAPPAPGSLSAPPAPGSLSAPPAPTSPSAPDRIESEPADFHQRVARGFAELARADPSRWAVVDGDAQVEVVAERVYAAVAEKLGLPDMVQGR